MTARKPIKPKAVEAWALMRSSGEFIGTRKVFLWETKNAASVSNRVWKVDARPIRVRIVPIKPKRARGKK